MNNKEIVNLLKLYIQKPSFIGLVSVNTDSWKEFLKDDMEMIRSWKLNHEKDYAHFKAEVMHASYGDYTAYTKMFKLAVSCIPQAVLQDIHNIMTCEESQSIHPELDSFISGLVNMQGYLEFNKGQVSKAAWNKEIISTTSNGKLRDEMLLVVRETKGISGRPRTATNIVTLNSLLQGDVRSVIALIKKYRVEMYRPVDLAYLFIILRQAELIKEHYYTIFHHAMEKLEGKKYNLRNPQEVYNNFPISEEILEKHGTAQQKRKAKEIGSWVDMFRVFRKSA